MLKERHPRCNADVLSIRQERPMQASSCKINNSGSALNVILGDSLFKLASQPGRKDCKCHTPRRHLKRTPRALELAKRCHSPVLPRLSRCSLLLSCVGNSGATHKLTNQYN